MSFKRPLEYLEYPDLVYALYYAMPYAFRSIYIIIDMNDRYGEAFFISE